MNIKNGIKIVYKKRLDFDEYNMRFLIGSLCTQYEKGQILNYQNPSNVIDITFMAAFKILYDSILEMQGNGIPEEDMIDIIKSYAKTCNDKLEVMPIIENRFAGTKWKDIIK